jgi:hypothetical protein
LLYSKPYDLVSLATSAMFPYPNPLLGQAEWRYFIRLRNLNLNHFKMAEAMGLKLPHHGPLLWHHLHTKFHLNSPIGSNVISGDGQTDVLISSFLFLERRLKWRRSVSCVFSAKCYYIQRLNEADWDGLHHHTPGQHFDCYFLESRRPAM